MVRARTIYTTPTRIGAGVRFARGTRLGTGRTPMLLRSGRAIGAYNPYVRAGLITATGLAAARQGLKKARAFRRKRLIIGERQGSSNAKVTVTNSVSVEGIAERVLYQKSINFPQQATTGSRDSRERQLIDLRGIKFCQDFVGLAALNSQTNNQVYLNIAVLTNKHLPQSTSINNNRFFRAANDKRGEDFDNLNSGIDYHCRPINSDEWNVLAHHRTMLAAPASPNGRNVVRFMKYIPIKRQIRFDQDGAPSHNVFICWWIALPGQQGGDLPTVIAQTTYRHVLYFRDPKR